MRIPAVNRVKLAPTRPQDPISTLLALQTDPFGLKKSPVQVKLALNQRDSPAISLQLRTRLGKTAVNPACGRSSARNFAKSQKWTEIFKNQESRPTRPKDSRLRPLLPPIPQHTSEKWTGSGHAGRPAETQLRPHKLFHLRYNNGRIRNEWKGWGEACGGITPVGGCWRWRWWFFWA